ncbi:hypothetical protein KEM48_008570 [Puccinia striiformis f. sp. tritici PST-130]|nr:hypothetical protein KEM48_008570 [Puccinia striiformis f. sp. tritici PST-130]
MRNLNFLKIRFLVKGDYEKILKQIAQLLASQNVSIPAAQPQPIPPTEFQPFTNSQSPSEDLPISDLASDSDPLIESLGSEKDTMVESGLDVVESDEIELVENVEEFSYGYGEPMDPPPAKNFNSMANLVEFV